MNSGDNDVQEDLCPGEELLDEFRYVPKKLNLLRRGENYKVCYIQSGKASTLQRDYIDSCTELWVPSSDPDDPDEPDDEIHPGSLV